MDAKNFKHWVNILPTPEFIKTNDGIVDRGLKVTKGGMSAGYLLQYHSHKFP